MKTQRLYVTDFVGLDLLRFGLSLVVILRHYYFFYYGHVELDQIVSSQPYFSILGLLYKWGGFAVQVFWLISGFIFFSIYHDEILNQEVSFKEFIFLRFSRLYPLHFVTLLVVAALQICYSFTHGNFFMYQTHDLKHFFLQLLFMSAWYPGFEHSYNIPVWSVSVEILVYVVFFLLAVGGVLKKRGLYAVTSLTIFFYVFDMFAPFSQCLPFFFAGCLLSGFLSETQGQRILVVKYLAVTVLLGAALVVIRNFYPNLSKYNIEKLMNLTLLPAASLIVLGFILIFRNLRSLKVISLFKELGNMTYSLYLVHVPVILSIVLIVEPKDHLLYDNPTTLIALLGVSIFIAWLVFRFLEKPAQKYLRNKFEAYQRAEKGKMQTNDIEVAA